MTAIRLPATFVEHIHDVLVGAFLPFDEKINPREYRDKRLIESAVFRAFHTGGGGDLMPSLSMKAAALFHALACNHCFINGNKRTAVIALDLFLAVNGQLLVMSSDEIYELAKTTARANEDKRNLDTVMQELATQIEESCFDFRLLQEEGAREKIGATYDKLVANVQRIHEFAKQIAKDYDFDSGTRNGS